MNKGLVSIISPCYNGESYIKPYLQSVLTQSYEKIELILVDDGSKDKTKNIIEEYKHLFEKKGYSLKYVYQENGGQAKAINTGLELVKGEYLMWVDSDDILLPDNVKRKVQYLEKNSEYGLVMCKAYIVNFSNTNKIIGEAFRRGNGDFFEELLFDGDVVFNPCVYMARMTAVKKAIPSLNIFESREGQNLQMLLPIVHMFSCGYIDEYLCKIVAHDDSHSRMRRTSQEQINREIGVIEIFENVINGITDLDDKEKSSLLTRINVYRWKKVWSKAKLAKNKKYIKLANKKLNQNGYNLKFLDYYKFFLKPKLKNTKMIGSIRKILRIFKKKVNLLQVKS